MARKHSSICKLHRQKHLMSLTAPCPVSVFINITINEQVWLDVCMHTHAFSTLECPCIHTYLEISIWHPHIADRPTHIWRQSIFYESLRESTTHWANVCVCVREMNKWLGKSIEMLTPMSWSKVHSYRLLISERKQKNEGPGEERLCDQVHDSRVSVRWMKSEFCCFICDAEEHC